MCFPHTDSRSAERVLIVLWNWNRDILESFAASDLRCLIGFSFAAAKASCVTFSLVAVVRCFSPDSECVLGRGHSHQGAARSTHFGFQKKKPREKESETHSSLLFLSTGEADKVVVQHLESYLVGSSTEGVLLQETSQARSNILWIVFSRKRETESVEGSCSQCRGMRMQLSLHLSLPFHRNQPGLVTRAASHA